MNDKEKYIKEMMKDLQKIKYSIPDEEDARNRIIACLDRQSCKELAVPLVNAGYRKQSEVAKEFAATLKERDEILIKDEIMIVVKEAVRENTTLVAVNWELAELNSNDVDHIAEMVADELYAAGYRKTFTSALASDTQKAFKEGFEKGKAEQNAELERIKIELRQKVDYIHEQDDVIKDYKLRAGVAEVFLALIDYQFKKMKHRADVAEKALLFLCDKTMSDVSAMIFPSTKTQVRNNQELYDYCIKQAKKELTEEKKEEAKNE